MASIIAFLGTIGTCLAIGALVDRFAEDHKKPVADFLMSSREASFHDFETSAIRGLMAPFVANGRLRFFRIFLLSLISTALCLYGFVALLDESIYVHYSELQALVELFGPSLIQIVLFLIVLSWPLDCLSLKITKSLFLDREPQFPKTWFFIAVDIFSSTGLYLVFAFVYLSDPFGIVSDLNLPGEVFYGFLVAAIGATLISVFQILVLLFGSTLKIIVLSCRKLIRFTNRSAWEESPFLAISALVGLTLAVLETFSV